MSYRSAQTHVAMPLAVSWRRAPSAEGDCAVTVLRVNTLTMAPRVATAQESVTSPSTALVNPPSAHKTWPCRTLHPVARTRASASLHSAGPTTSSASNSLVRYVLWLQNYCLYENNKLHI